MDVFGVPQHIFWDTLKENIKQIKQLVDTHNPKVFFIFNVSINYFF